MTQSTYSRVAQCGHSYVVSGDHRGRARRYGDCSCKRVPLAASDVARLAAAARWDRPGMRERAGAVARQAAAARWGNRTERACGCGHIVPIYSGRYLEKCDACCGIVCEWEGCDEAVARNRRWCAEHKAMKERMKSPDSGTSVCSEPDCGRPLRARGLCSMHHKRLLRSEGKMQEPWNDRRKNVQHARRARKAGNTVGDSVTIEKLVSRDGAVCGLCRGGVDLTLDHPNPMSKSIDHIVPISRGGSHSMENCQLAHLSCNVRKGARAA